MNRCVLLNLCLVLVVVAVLASVEAAPREKRQILGAILDNVFGDRYGRGGHSGEHFGGRHGGHSGERFGGQYGWYGYPGYNLGYGNYQGYYGGYNQDHSGERHHSSHERY